MGFDTRFAGEPPGWEAPATTLVAVTPDNTTNISGGMVRGLWVGAAGNLAVVAPDDTANAVLIENVPAGTLLPIAAVRINATNTTASKIVGLR